MKTATKRRNTLLMLTGMFGFLACSFGDPTYDHDPISPLTSMSSGGAKLNFSQGGNGSADCPASCSIISIQGYKPRTGFAPSKSVLGLKAGELCLCSSSGGTTGTTTSTDVAGNGSTEDPPPEPQGGAGDTLDPPSTGGTTGTDYPSYGGDSSTGGTSAVGGDGSTLDPPPNGGAGNTQDPPVGGTGNTEDPPPTGGTSATGGASSVTGGTGNTQDPPPAGSSGIAGMTGTGGGSTLDPPVGGKSSTGGSSATGGSKATGGSSSTGGSFATGGNTGTGGSSNCTKQSYKFYVTEAQEGLGSGVVTCTNLTTQKVVTTSCSDASCCYYNIPTSCDRWACHQINQSTGMTRIPSYDPQTQTGILDWGGSAIITTGDHYWLEEGVDYNIVCDANHLCDLVLEPHAGERFYL